ncbi:hypothetical protein ACFXAS_04335 [Streptomyces sp. NPDC059459]|uniref:hypothetical protein n=1 Tax=Streptomyces sp. NPDC059459 TaxID=3346839 RepID=UPI0036C6FBD7
MDEVTRRTRSCAGCLVAGAVGASTAVLAWAPLARISVTGGFENRHRDLGVLYLDLPLVAVGGALVPVAAWAVGLRVLGGRAWAAALLAVAALVLGTWGLTAWWTPYEEPEFMG